LTIENESTLGPPQVIEKGCWNCREGDDKQSSACAKCATTDKWRLASKAVLDQRYPPDKPKKAPKRHKAKRKTNIRTK